MKLKATIVVFVVLMVSGVIATLGAQAQKKHHNVLIDLWAQGKATFGVYVPSEAPRGQPAKYTKETGEKLSQNPLVDFVFLNLEESYDGRAIKTLGEGLRSSQAVGRKTYLVRIPPIDKDGADTTKARVNEAFDGGADGVVIPHIQSPEQAKLAVSFFAAAKADVWSPSNPNGEKVAMLMIEDPDSIAKAKEIADTKGYSILACGIGSLTQALKGDRPAAEIGNQKVLAESKRVKVADMITANASDIEKRVKEGFLALLMQGPTADDTIKIGRQAAGR